MTEPPEEYLGVNGELSISAFSRRIAQHERDIERIHEVFNEWDKDIKVTIRGLESRIETLEYQVKRLIALHDSQGEH